MPLLNTADRVYFGAAQADRVYLGAHLVWPPTYEYRLVFPGVLGNHLTVPHSAPFNTTDLEVVARIELRKGWTSGSNIRAIIGRDTNGTNRSWSFIAANDAKLFLYYWNTGGSQKTAVSTAAIPYTDGTMCWVKVTRVVSTGKVQFFYAPDAAAEPATWTKLGNDVSTTVGEAMRGTDSGIAIGTRNFGINDPYAGRIARTIFRSGVAGSAVLDVSEDNAAPAYGLPSGATFPAAVGGTVTVVQTTGNTIVQRALLPPT